MDLSGASLIQKKNLKPTKRGDESMTKYEQVTVKVPKVLMQLIRDQNYFGRTPEKFFTDCVKRGVDCELSMLDYDEVECLERKYGIEHGFVVDLSKATL